MSIILTINSGSSSKKYALFVERATALEFRFERTTAGFEVCTKEQSVQNCVRITREEFEDAFNHVAEGVKKYLYDKQLKLDALVIRIVAPGEQFQKHQRIDESLILQLRQHEFSVPLHIPTTLKEIQDTKEHFPGVPLIGASDSAFHTTLPERARNYSIDRSDAETYDIFRFGYHGLSVASVARRIHPLTGSNPAKMVVVHVGDGVSVTAVKDYESVETTMGYAPASGLPMGSRAGDLDASALLHLMRAKNLKPSEAAMYIHTKGGLTGLFAESDIRRLFDRCAKDDAVARQTFDMFVYHIKKAIAAATVSLQGLDTLVLTGTACSRSAELRQAIVQELDYFNIDIDEDRNEALVGKDGVFSKRASPVKLVAIRTDEMGEMAIIGEQLSRLT